MPVEQQICQMEPLQIVLEDTHAVVFRYENLSPIVVSPNTRASTPTAVKYVEQPQPKMAEELPLEASVKTPIRRRTSSSPSPIEGAKNRRISFSPPLLLETYEPELPVAVTPEKKSISASPGSTKPSKQLEGNPLSNEEVPKQLEGNPLPAQDSDVNPTQKAENDQKNQNYPVVEGKKDIGQALKIGGSSETDIPEPPFEVLASCSIEQQFGENVVLNKSCQLSLQIQLNKELMENEASAMQRRMTNRKQVVSQLQSVRLLIEKQKAELNKNESEKANLKREVANMQKKLKHFQVSNTKLFDLNNKLIIVLKKHELENQKMVAERVAVEEFRLKREISQLKSEITEKIIQLTAKLQNQTLLANETAKQLELSQREGITMRTLLDEKESINISLNNRIKDMETAHIQLIEVNEDYARELDAEKAKSLTEWKARKDVIGLIKIVQIINEDSEYEDEEIVKEATEKGIVMLIMPNKEKWLVQSKDLLDALKGTTN